MVRDPFGNVFQIAHRLVDPLANTLVDDVLDAISAGAPEQARLALHPYMNWTDGSGVTTRGRTRVLTMLGERSARIGRPAVVELRDSQIYRWRESPGALSAGAEIGHFMGRRGTVRPERRSTRVHPSVSCLPGELSAVSCPIGPHRLPEPDLRVPVRPGPIRRLPVGG